MGFIIFNTEQHARDMFEKEGLIPVNVHPALVSSWQRSRKYNIDPFIDAAPTVSREPKNDMENLLIQIAKPYLDYFRNCY